VEIDIGMSANAGPARPGAITIAQAESAKMSRFIEGTSVANKTSN
jgi:hypothetical protein